MLYPSHCLRMLNPSIKFPFKVGSESKEVQLWADVITVCLFDKILWNILLWLIGSSEWERIFLSIEKALCDWCQEIVNEWSWIKMHIDRSFTRTFPEVPGFPFGIIPLQWDLDDAECILIRNISTQVTCSWKQWDSKRSIASIYLTGLNRHQRSNAVGRLWKW